MKKRPFLSFFLLLTATLLWWSCNNPGTTTPPTGGTPSDSGTATGTVSILINLTSGPKAVSGIPHTQGMTILDAMKIARDEHKLAFRDTTFPGMGPFINEVESIAPANGYFWMFCVNDTSGTVGVSAKVLNLGDQVEWHYVNTENPPCKPSN
jgi:hypothetical protein